MTTGLNDSAGHQDGNNFTAYLAATTDLTRQSGSGLAVNNASGMAQVRWGWGL